MQQVRETQGNMLRARIQKMDQELMGILLMPGFGSAGNLQHMFQ
jgi:hypothetical protein